MYDLPDLTEVEARATAQDRLDLYFEHLDALSVRRAGLRLADYLRRFADVRVEVAGHQATGAITAAGSDWVGLSSGLVLLDACQTLSPSGRGDVPGSPLSYRQAVRQYTSRVPRDLVLRGGRLLRARIEWVGADFVHVNSQSGAQLLPLREVVAVFGRLGQ